MGYYDIYVKDPLVSENAFINAPRQQSAPPSFAQARALLPDPFWQGHESVIRCYWRAWELAFRNLKQPTAENGFISNYIGTAFNDCLFMWDSAFILMFGKYGRRAFDFLATLDNLYAKQHPDGFICREIAEGNGEDRFHRFDPASTGPNTMPWTEWEYYCTTGDIERLRKVFPVLLAYHRWLRAYRTWRDGSYWSCGWATGCDNTPRLPDGLSSAFYHGHYVWADACLQQTFSAHLLDGMARAVGRQGETEDLRQEAARLTRFVNERLWNEETGFYSDMAADGSLSRVKFVGAYWALLAGVAQGDRLARFAAHLENEREFNRPHRVPSLSADDPGYKPEGEYWRGGVWASSNYMVLRGLSQSGYDALAHGIAMNHLGNVVSVFEDTGTLWEYHAPEAASPGWSKDLPDWKARTDFVGWGGLPPVGVLLEYVFGLRPDVPANLLVWDVRLLEEHGVRRYPFGKSGTLSLRCPARSSAAERPAVEAYSNVPVALEIRWGGGSETLMLGGSPDL